MLKFAANLSMMFNEVPFLERFGAAAQAGFRAVEFLFPYEFTADDIAERLQKHGLTQALFNVPPGDWAKGERGLTLLPGRESEFATGVEQAIEYAKVLKCDQIHIMAGIAPAGVQRNVMMEVYVTNLSFAAHRLAAENIRALIEPINYYDVPGYFLNTQAEARAVIDKVGSDNLFLQQDLYHCQIMEGNLAKLITEYRDIARHYQIAGVPGRHEPDLGEINHPYLFDLIDQLGYTGYIGCEYRPRGDTREGLGWAAKYGIS
ncbi:MAG: 2-oxo-tetronate isomerase [Burkholderiales bacterium]